MGTTFWYSGNRAVLVYSKVDPDGQALRLAYESARWLCRHTMARDDGPALEVEAVHAAIDRARQALKRHPNIKALHAAIKNKTNEARIHVAGVVAGVDQAIAELFSTPSKMTKPPDPETDQGPRNNLGRPLTHRGGTITAARWNEPRIWAESRFGREFVMAEAERVTTISQTVDDALTTVARALASAGFRNVIVSESAKMVTAEARRGGQWTKDPITVLLAPKGEGTTELTIRAKSTAQSLVSLVRSPAQRNVEKVLKALVT